jgi:hypothetical protein
MTVPDHDPLERFARERNLDYGILRGNPYRHRHGISIDSYTIEHGVLQGRCQGSVSDRITGVRITEPTRFANSIMQLTNAINVAKSLGAQRLHLPFFWYLQKGANNGKSGLEINNESEPNLSADDMVLAGKFLKMAALSPLCSSRLSPRKAIRELRHLLKLNINSTAYGNDDLVIHVRSGDIFQTPHNNYGQPPLAFYKKIVRANTWNAVHVVFENRLNPVISPLLEWLPDHCNETIVVSGKLQDDLQVLLNARTIVSGRSTFINSICALSRNLRRVYYWHDKPFDTWGNPKVRTIGVIDKIGAYASAICNGNWINSDEQRQLMIDYPESSFCFRDS